MRLLSCLLFVGCVATAQVYAGVTTCGAVLTATVTPPERGSTKVVGSLDTQMIRRAIAVRNAQVRGCYEKLLATQPTAAGARSRS